MDKVDEDKIKALIHSIGLKYNLQDEVIKKIVNSPYKFTRQIITSLEIDNVESEEEFSKIKTNFIYKYLGKLYTSFTIIRRHKKQQENLINYNKEKWKNKET